MDQKPVYRPSCITCVVALCIGSWAVLIAVIACTLWLAKHL